MRTSVPAHILLWAILFSATFCNPQLGAAAAWSFVEITQQAGVRYKHGFMDSLSMTWDPYRALTGGVASGDYNNDGYTDLYAVGGDIGPNRLYKNLQNGTFQEVAAFAGVALPGVISSGPTFADLNGDGWLDLLVGGIEGPTPYVFINNGDETFGDSTSVSGMFQNIRTFSSACGDYDRDGDIDVALGHWGTFPPFCGMIWKNDGTGKFTCDDANAGVTYSRPGSAVDNSFTPNFADINNDGWPDLLMAADFTSSMVYMNDGDGTFTDVTDLLVITDENGMGATVGDYDNDGDLDWFVSSIFDVVSANRPTGGPRARTAPQFGQTAWGVTGNRMYRNTGNGVFEDATDEAGVRQGFWGWGSSFVDFNNDGFLDIYHVNGWQRPDTTTFHFDPARMFVATGTDSFEERSTELGVDHTGQGRGIACFDLENDGDIDIFISNCEGFSVLYENIDGNANNYLSVKLQGVGLNTECIGGRVYVTTAGGHTQMREIRAGSNYLSQDPARAHFGLGSSLTVNTLRVVWSDGTETVQHDVAAGQRLTISKPSSIPNPTPGANPRITDVRPNPFAEDLGTDEVSVLFETRAGATGSINVYDIGGRFVRTLKTPQFSGGQDMVTWDTRDSKGNRVASGVYLIRIETSNGTHSRRVIVLR